MVKSFSPTELAARIQAAPRKQDPPAVDLPGFPMSTVTWPLTTLTTA